jgi:hypothetical protein
MITAIDPGLRGCGIAIYSTDAERFITLSKWQLWDVFDYIDACPEDFYIVEDSNLNKNNWHGATGRGNVGKNKAVSTLIVEFLKHRKRDFIAIKPDGYSKRYTDSKGRFTNFYKEVFEKETGWKGVSNKDSRAAAAMVICNKNKI